MALIVQKYGGTSVASVERIQAVAQRIYQTVKAGNSVVAVVSAMGKTTDGLVKLAKEISPHPNHREMDMLLSTGEQVTIALLSMALQELGQPAISMTGAQVGIVTEAEHTRARILNVETERLIRQINAGKVVVVAGFQGTSNKEELEITTLGRGGSDTSAVALAAALRADFCEIYTDVPGIFTTDPRLVPEAQLMSEITCDEMLELASLGAKVLHPRSVEIARNYGIPLVVRSSWTDQPGTWVTTPEREERALINLELGRCTDIVEFDGQQARVALLRVPDQPGIAARLFGEIARQNVDVDLIIQSIHEGNSNDIAFTVAKNILNRAEAVALAIAPALRNQANSDQAEVMVEENTAKVSIVGAGMIGHPGVAAQMFAALAAAQVNIQMISTSEVKVSCVVDIADCDRAISSLCRAFEIHASPRRTTATVTNNIAAVRAVALDINQAQLAIRQVPDRPGMAAKLFGLLAEYNISVDMIIQSQRCRIIDGTTRRDIAFTLARTEAENAQSRLSQLAPELGWGEVVLDSAIAKVSIVGSGMVGHPGIAAQMFTALAENNINIQMIATSEIKISCVVPEAEGVKALKAVHTAFNLAGSQKFVVPV
jgi:aspartate kinase